MNVDRWRRIQDLRNAAQKLEPEQRRTFLAEACAGDQELRRAIDSLLDRPDAATTIAPLNAPDWHATISGGPSASTRSLPSFIGRYRVLRLLGEGGMGVVYEAEQDQPRRTVALKVIKPGLTSVDPERRFEQETRALGRLQHPGIAQIYEAGTADTGSGPQQYFAMEFIRGHSLCEYAAGMNLHVRQRLQLMINICDAVHHAHQRGVIHRDLKPGNILVDEAGQPKILDFGVAHATDSDAHATRQTDLGQLVGTLAYMSPEQVLGDPLALDIRSDVYALGVIFYELLAGRMPYQINRKLYEAVQTIREEDPARLSSISRVYRGDIETIVAKALEKDKARRYASAADLAADIQHYLCDEPIVARPASTGYQLRKFARRHKALVSGVTAVFVVLAAGIVASTWQAARANQARQAAVEQRDRATAAERAATRERDRAVTAERAAAGAEEQALKERNRALAEKQRADNEAATAKAISDFLQNDLLAQASQVGTKGRRGKPEPDLKVRTVLDRSAAGIGDRFQSQPVVEASIRSTIGLAYYGLGLYPEAERQMERSANLRRRTVGPQHPDTLDSLSYLADTYREQGRFAEAESLFQRVVETQTRVLGAEAPDTISSKNNLALVYLYQGKYALAEPLLVSVVKASRRFRGEENPETLSDMNNLAVTYGYLGKFGDAEQLYRELLDVLRRQLGDEHPQTLNVMSNLADVYRAEGKYAEAEPLVTSALEMRRRLLGDTHPETLISMSVVALLYRNLGRFSEAEPLFTKVLDGRRHSLGERHVDTLKSATYLADLYRNEGKESEAEALYLKTIESLRNMPGGQDHPQTLNSMASLGLLYLGQRRYAEAEQLFIGALEGRRRKLGPEHPSTANIMALLGRCFLEQGRYIDADGMIRGAFRIQEKNNPDGWERSNTESMLGALLAGEQKYTEAEPLLLSGYRGLTERQAAIPWESRLVVEQAGARVVQLYEHWGKPDKAAEWRTRLRRR